MPETGFRLKGIHVLAGFTGAFGVIIAVNMALAINAVRSFPGLEVKNSYVASQSFDARRTAQQALGWQASAKVEDGRLILALTDANGAPVQAGTLTALLGRATHDKDDRHPDFVFDGSRYTARLGLDPGNWMLRVTATALDGTLFEQRLSLYVRDAKG